MNLVRLFLVITALFLSFILISCGEDDKAGVTGACQVYDNQYAKKVRSCIPSITSANCSGIIGLVVKDATEAGVEDDILPVGKFVPNAGCKTTDVASTCKVGPLTTYLYNTGTEDNTAKTLFDKSCKDSGGN